MRIPAVVLCCSLAALQLTGCNTQNAQQPKPPEPPEPGTLQEPYVIINNTVMRFAPSEDPVVPVPNAPGRTTTNFIGNITRGHVSTLLERRGFWSHVVLDDDAEGWILTVDMLPARQVNEATVLEETILYGAPSEKAPPAARLAPGDLLFVAEERGDFSKVYGTTPSPLYVPSKRLSHEANELAMSHMLLRMHMAQQVNDAAEAVELLDEARLNFPNTQLLDVMAENVDFMHTNEPPHTHNSRFHRLPAQ